MKNKHKNEIEEIKKAYEEKINKMKIKYEEEIEIIKKENADLKLRLDNMLQEYQNNLKEKDSGTKKVRNFL